MADEQGLFYAEFGRRISPPSLLTLWAVIETLILKGGLNHDVVTVKFWSSRVAELAQRARRDGVFEKLTYWPGEYLGDKPEYLSDTDLLEIMVLNIAVRIRHDLVPHFEQPNTFRNFSDDATNGRLCVELTLPPIVNPPMRHRVF